MKRFGLLLTALAACASADDAAHFHGTVRQSVTHVMAVSPIAGDLEKVVVPTNADGSFEIAVDTGRPWAFVFVNSSATGADMVRGVLRADTLDTFLPQAAGDIDLGMISIDGRDATMAGSSEDLDAALGLSRRTLATIGGLDDLALRYANPDIDGDGVLDIEQGHLASLEIHAEYELMISGRPATPNDLIGNSHGLDYQHLGTGIYGRLPEAFGKVERGDADVTFDMPYYGYETGDNTAPVPAGQPIEQLTFGDDRTFGVFCRPNRAIPSGNYKFRSGEHTLAFTLVRPPNDMTMHQVMPRLTFIPKDPACQRNCELSHVEFSWERKTDGAWVQLTEEEAQALMPTGSVSIVFMDGSTRRLDFPVGVASGSVPWELDLRAVQPHYRTDHITYASVAFQSRPGMKMYARLGDSTQSDRPFGLPEIDAEFTH